MTLHRVGHASAPSERAGDVGRHHAPALGGRRGDFPSVVCTSIYWFRMFQVVCTSIHWFYMFQCIPGTVFGLVMMVSFWSMVNELFS